MSKTINVACTQMRPKFGDTSGNFRYIFDTVSSINAKSLFPNGRTLDLMLFPELATSGYEFRGRDEVAELAIDVHDNAEIKGLKSAANTYNVNICFGFPERSGNRLYNSVALIEPSGRITVYRKIHLFDREKERFDPGNEPPPVVQTTVGRLGLMICFDWIFPETARMLALQGAQILLHPSNLVLAYCQRAMYARSIENRVFSMTCNRIGSEDRDGRELTFTGASQILSPRGETVAQADELNQVTITATINPSDADDKMITPLNHVHDDRRTDIYRKILE